MSLLLNLENNELISQSLIDFKEEAKKLSPKDRGISIGNNVMIRDTHNKFGYPDALYIPEIPDYQAKTGEAYHFVSYIPINGKVYELDGLRKGPICLGEVGEDYKSLVIEEIKRRIGM